MLIKGTQLILPSTEPRRLAGLAPSVAPERHDAAEGLEYSAREFGLGFWEIRTKGDRKGLLQQYWQRPQWHRQGDYQHV